ncbi:(R,R)-butanediol dehydrogenase / meso-butanediol dehydrogenase / diacetyl reductase [Halopelagius inordinatus]|uniref:(R,R)-butanediol dehydrogenase / meso-butanediol dehydrogenase / diacetyl reductase n=1 Tax=Halopelagius inordinatus TaxID=553467 RepID=A0A1I2NMW8_9EURY|nr:2,3-butanediol dehydrogenase [Halopelagius inordinatus]SFG03027.1 (R,R)-butanediol dehydrogenase / meso-butanediol dehydrogenase / diacetyl reductase [Halopelagius inordinatus]
MQAARYHGQQDVRVESIDEDEVGPRGVLLDVDSCGICGTDLHEYTAGPIFVPDDEPHPVTRERMPITMGHEFSGTVAEVGPEVESVAVGDEVAVNPTIWCGDCRQCERGRYHLCVNGGFVGLSGGGGGFSERVVVDENQAVRLGDISLEEGAVVEPLAVGLHAVRRSGLRAGDTVTVVGSGPIGLSVIQAARAAGAGKILVSEPRQSRRARAADCGADVLVNPMERDFIDAVADETDGAMADCSFEVAGLEATLSAALQSLSVQGNCTIVSIWEGAVPVNPNDVVMSERTVTGTLAYQSGPRSDEDFGAVIEMLSRGEMSVEPLVTDRIGLDDIDSGFRSLLDDESDQVKILVKP